MGSAGTWIPLSHSHCGLWEVAGRTVPSCRACCASEVQGTCFLHPSWGPGAHFLPVATWLKATGGVSGWMRKGLQLAGGRGPRLCSAWRGLGETPRAGRTRENWGAGHAAPPQCTQAPGGPARGDKRGRGGGCPVAVWVQDVLREAGSHCGHPHGKRRGL